jgi:Ion transport protein
MAKIIVYGLILPHSITLSNTTQQTHLTRPLGSSLPASVLGKCLSFFTFGFVRPKEADGTRPTKNSNIQLSPITPTSLPSNLFSPLPTGDVGRPDHVPATMLKHRPYLTNFGNWLDLISVVCYWIDLALMKINYNNVSLFKAVGAARPLRLVGIIPGTAVSMQIEL